MKRLAVLVIAMFPVFGHSQDLSYMLINAATIFKNICISLLLRSDQIRGTNCTESNRWDFIRTGDVDIYGNAIYTIETLIQGVPIPPIRRGCIVDQSSTDRAAVELNCNNSHRANPKYRWVLVDLNSADQYGRKLYQIKSLIGDCMEQGESSNRIYMRRCKNPYEPRAFQIWRVLRNL